MNPQPLQYPTMVDQYLYPNPQMAAWNPYLMAPMLQAQAPNQQGNISNRQRRRNNKYCWTHGGCKHQGSDCTHKAQGHKNEATFANKMRSSTKNYSS